MPPKEFNSCLEAGGKVRTKTLKGGKFIHICIPKGGGASVAGEVKTKSKTPSRSKTRREIKKEYGA